MASSLISVLMPVRNGEAFVRDAIESILHQTYSHFELIIVDDGSTDNTNFIIKSYSDVRIKLLKTTGIGLVAALNLALSYATGEYIARMDADDISLANRFKEQINIFEKNSDIGVVCSDVILIDENNLHIGFEKDVIKTSSNLVRALSFKSSIKPIIHPSVMIRSNLLRDVNGYRNYKSAEDRDLWLRLSKITKFYRISSPLLKYRKNENGVSVNNTCEQKANAMLAVFNNEVSCLYGIDLYNCHLDLLTHFYKLFYSYSLSVSNKNKSFYIMKKRYYSNRTIFGKLTLLGQIITNIDLVIYYFMSLRNDRKKVDLALNQIRSYFFTYNNFRSN